MFDDAVATIFQVILTVVLALAVAMGLISLSAPHTVKGYYLQQESWSSGPLSCVEADVDWALDYTVFCSPDINSAGEVMERLRQDLKPRRPQPVQEPDVITTP